jgi:hypothetical protein
MLLAYLRCQDDFACMSVGMLLVTYMRRQDKFIYLSIRMLLADMRCQDKLVCLSIRMHVAYMKCHDDCLSVRTILPYMTHHFVRNNTDVSCATCYILVLGYSSFLELRGLTAGWKDRQSDAWIDRQIDSQTHRQKERKTDRQTDGRTDRQILRPEFSTPSHCYTKKYFSGVKSVFSLKNKWYKCHLNK